MVSFDVKFKGREQGKGEKQPPQFLMQFKLISWNVRQLNCRDKRRLVKSLVFDLYSDIYCFHETKLEEDLTKLVEQI